MWLISHRPMYHILASLEVGAIDLVLQFYLSPLEFYCMGNAHWASYKLRSLEIIKIFG